MKDGANYREWFEQHALDQNHAQLWHEYIVMNRKF